MSLLSIPVPPIPGSTRLITKADEAPVYTARRNVDVRSALTKGLAEYLSGLEVVAEGGRFLAFRKAFYAWAEPEDVAEYPSVIVLANLDGTYVDSKLSPGLNPRKRLPEPDGRYFVEACDYQLDMQVQVWTNDHNARMVLADAVENAMFPTTWMYGIRLELPFYHGVFAEYELYSSGYVDSEIDADRRIRRATFTVRGRLPVVRLAKFPAAIAESRVTVQEEAL